MEDGGTKELVGHADNNQNLSSKDKCDQKD